MTWLLTPLQCSAAYALQAKQRLTVQRHMSLTIAADITGSHNATQGHFQCRSKSVSHHCDAR